MSVNHNFDPFAVQPAKTVDPYALLIEWDRAKKTAATAIEQEREARAAVAKAFFPNPVKGTNRVPLQNDHHLKYVLGYDYSFKIPGDEKAKPDKVAAAATDLFQRIAAISEAASLYAKRLIKYKAEPSASEYAKLCEEAEAGNGTAIAVKQLFDKLLFVKEASPQLMIEEPKS